MAARGKTSKYPALMGYILTRTRVIQIVQASFLMGLLLVRYGWRVDTYLLLLAAALTLITVATKNRFWFAALAVLALMLGIWRGQTVFTSFQPLFERYHQKVTLSGTVQDDAAAADRYQTEFHLHNLRLLETGDEIAAGGRIIVRGFPELKINRGDLVVVSGKLRPALGNNQGQINFAEVTTVAQKQHWLENLRRRFFAGVRTALPEPQASLGLGFLVGLRSLLPDSLLDQLTITGLTHIVAVSGYNLTILIRFTRRLLAKHSKYLATAASVFLIIGFLAVTGLSPSIFRAAIISGLSLAAWYYGRPIGAAMLLLIASSVTAGINPTFIWYDIGWYLSFLAFFGVLVVAPTITQRLFRKRQPTALIQLMIESFSAQAMVIPLIAFIFGNLSLIGLVANMVILPIIPFAMLVTFVAGVGGMLVPGLVGWIAWPANIVLSFIVRTVQWFANVPWANVKLSLLNWQLAVIYSSMFIAIWVMRRRLNQLPGSKNKPAYNLVE